MALFFARMLYPHTDPADLRDEYQFGTLDLTDVLPDPIAQFERWFNEAVAYPVPEPTAMHLATVGEHGLPSGRMVLLKGLSPEGFVFYTNYESRKGHHLGQSPHCALTFFWQPLERQVRIEGLAQRLSAQESLAYYQSRPRGSQIGAWASPQSQPIADRAELERRFRETEARFEHQPTLELPPYWGGYRVIPRMLEFWQGRPSRLHDRIVYERTDTGWALSRLAP